MSLKHSDKVVARAAELYEQDQAKWREQQSLAGALGEMDVPAEYLDRAAEDVQSSVKQKRRRTITAMWAGGLLVVVGSATWALMHRRVEPATVSMQMPTAPPRTAHGGPEPSVLHFPALASPVAPIEHSVFDDVIADRPYRGVGDTTWESRHNIDSHIAVRRLTDTFRRGYVEIAIDKFIPTPIATPYTPRSLEYIPEDNFSYYVYLDCDSLTIDGYHTVTFQARTTGTLSANLALISNKQQWNSGPIHLAKDWRYYTVPFNRLTGQAWINGRMRPITGTLEQTEDYTYNHFGVEFDFGETINDVTAHGAVDISDVTFQ